MAYPPPAGYQPVRGVRDRTEQDVLDTQDRVREEVRRDYDQQSGQHFYIDNEVMLSCWAEIWRWLNVSSLSSHLLKYGVVSDPSELYLLTSPYQTPRQRADHLLTLVYKGGAYGCHLLYMCIRDDDENPLGHASAVEKLIAVARAKGKRAPRELFGVYQQHLVYERDGAVGDRERAEPDDEAGPQSVEADGTRHRRRDDAGGEGSGEGGPPIQESGQSATITRVNTEGVIGNGIPAAHMSLHAAEEETNQWPQQRLIAGQSETRERIRRQSGDAARRQSEGEGGQRTARSRDEGQRTGSVSSSVSDNSLLSSPMSPPATTSESTSERRVPSSMPLLPPSSFTTPNSTPSSSTPVCPSSSFPSAGSAATSSGPVPMRRVVSYPPLSQGPLGCEEITKLVQDMIICQSMENVSCLTENKIDVQFAEIDEASTIEDLMFEILQYTTACLNSRIKYRAGVFIAGVETDEEGTPRVIGLPLSDREIAKLRGRVSNNLPTCVFYKTPQGDPQPETSGRIMPMLRVSDLLVPSLSSSTAATPSPPSSPDNLRHVVYAIVLPDWGVCQNKLYLFCEQRRRVVYQCSDGAYNIIRGPSIKQLLNTLDHAYSEIDHAPLNEEANSQ